HCSHESLLTLNSYANARPIIVKPNIGFRYILAVVDKIHVFCISFNHFLVNNNSTIWTINRI
ncbi:MAG: hypothetical protein JSV04_05705, partial [Candidatus Heimdallarchaeota archaeon]